MIWSAPRSITLKGSEVGLFVLCSVEYQGIINEHDHEQINCVQCCVPKQGKH